MIASLTALSLSVALLGPPERVEADAPPKSAKLPPSPKLPPEQRARRLFIAGGVLFGLAALGETIGAALSTTCELGQACALGLTFTWGSEAAGTRYTVFSTGTGSPYVLSRVVAIPFIASGEALMLSGAHLRSEADARAGRPPPFSRRLAWTLTGTGLGIYLASRLMRLGFALGGVCQQPGCVYAFDRATLEASRALALPGSAMLVYLRTRADLRLGLTPVGSLGLGLAGEF